MRNTNAVLHIIRVAMKYINAFQDYLRQPCGSEF